MARAPDAFADDRDLQRDVCRVPAAVNSLTMVTLAAANAHQSLVGATNVIYYHAATVLNDNFANASKVPVAGATYFSNNKFATLEAGEPAHDSVTNDAASLWWSWTPSTATNVFIDTIGSQIDTVLAVYTGSTLAMLQTPAGGWRQRAAAMSQSQPAFVSFNAQAGVPYQHYAPSPVSIPTRSVR